MSKDIGGKVKELRTRKKMTLKELGEKTSLSTGFLSQLERGLTSIATDSLEKIAEAVDVDLSYFFVGCTKNRNSIIRSYEKEVFQIINGHFVHYHLTNNSAEKAILPRLIELLPINCSEDISPYAHEGEEFVYVLEGTLTLFLNNEQFELFPGDSAHYNSSIVHNWANYTNKMVRLLVTSVPNPFKE
ncbi:helix-turn-helix domain-containing protein [Sporomusa malonica]|uniref:Transcriptional regulator, XRE family with cupin sensor n=1 Tax=Sporomusa malonica TaxID=112901 RepID=A0A1W2E066_9FIRM|nr:XRE family transcriptional regulator [Sporomusa malonica]SMD02716.1 transcriptional regulator, XRE family with cupin sensor [Sporomusa malonica]